MKSALVTLFVLIIHYGTAQDSTAFTISKTVTVESVSKDELYNRAKRWIAASYPPGLDVIQADDKGNDTITVVSFFSVSANNDLMNRLEEGTVKYVLTFKCADGTCKYTLQDFIHTGGEGYGSGGNLNNRKPDCGNFKLSKGGWEDIKRQAEDYVSHLIHSLEEGINNLSDASKSDKW